MPARVSHLLNHSDSASISAPRRMMIAEIQSHIMKPRANCWRRLARPALRFERFKVAARN